MYEDFYQRLKILSSASSEEIKRAYKRQSKYHHPDKTGLNDSSSFRNIQEAYETLSDIGRRQLYDCKNDLSLQINILAADALSGIINFCTRMKFHTFCPIRGWSTLEEIVHLPIPPGTKDGHTMSINSMSSPSSPPTNLIIRIHNEEETFWTKRSISLWEALVGFRIHFKHQSGTRCLILSEPGRIYQTGDVLLTTDSVTQTSVHIKLHVRFPTHVSAFMRRSIEQEICP
jgi:DnaJ-class molecular chaperone